MITHENFHHLLAALYFAMLSKVKVILDLCLDHPSNPNHCFLSQDLQLSKILSEFIFSNPADRQTNSCKT